MTEQIGASNNTSPTLTFYVVSMGVRRLLIPEVRAGENGYNCVTITNVGSEETDRIMPTQTDFEKVLVDMRLMETDAPSRQLGPAWPSAVSTRSSVSSPAAADSRPGCPFSSNTPHQRDPRQS